VLIQLAQCRFPGLAISIGKILIRFSNKIYGSSFIKQHSETVIVLNYQSADYSLRKKILLFVIIFGTLSFPMQFSRVKLYTFAVYILPSVDTDIALATFCFCCLNV